MHTEDKSNEAKRSKRKKKCERKCFHSFNYIIDNTGIHANLSLFYRYYFGRCPSAELAQLVPLPYSQERSTHYSDRLHDFSVTIPRCYKGVYVNIVFSRRVN